MRALVTGAGGMLGRDVTEALAAHGHEIFALTRSELDITDGPAVDATVGRIEPDVIVNCAAYTDVDGAESNERAATVVNDTGAGLLAVAAGTVGAKVVYPSTDYVFDGNKGRPYLESDMPHPISAYGRTKLAGETSVAVANSRHIVVRTSWLFGAGGKNFVETMLRLGGEQSEVLVVSDQVGSPTYTAHLGRAIALLAESEDYGVHHVTASGSCSWFEFAQEIFDQAGLGTRVMAARTSMLDRPAPRPSYSVLGSEWSPPAVLPNWREALAEYLAAREAAGAAAGGAG
ncbi:MAG: dTDP-4-dehydrorhamnose reductase [Solirubrobacterales bacterium]